MLPLEPTLCSTTIGWPSRSERSGCMTRAATSGPPPGAIRTTSLIGLLGYCASAPPARVRPAARATALLIPRNRIIGSAPSLLHRTRGEHFLQLDEPRREALLVRVACGGFQRVAIGADTVPHERRAQRLRALARDQACGDVVLHVLQTLLVRDVVRVIERLEKIQNRPRMLLGKFPSDDHAVVDRKDAGLAEVPDALGERVGEERLHVRMIPQVVGATVDQVGSDDVME